MIGTTYNKIMETILNTIVEIGSKNTSRGYMFIVLDTLVNQNKKKFKALKFIKIKTTSFSPDGSNIEVDPDINELSEKEVSSAIQQIIDSIKNSCEKNSANNEFYSLLKGYLGYQYVIKLENIGIKLS